MDTSLAELIKELEKARDSFELDEHDDPEEEGVYIERGYHLAMNKAIEIIQKRKEKKEE